MPALTITQAATFPVKADHTGLRFFVNHDGKSGFQIDFPNGWTASAFQQWGDKYWNVAAWRTYPDRWGNKRSIYPKPDGADQDGDMVAAWLSYVAHKRQANG